MKVNLKKIGAIVAGATILASTAAFAGLMFGSTTLVDDNGAPVAKVVVGSNAQPSDGVAAALIAGAIVSNTYKSQTLTAQVAGTASCTPSSGNMSSNATGTCSISGQKATLAITVPNTVAQGTWTGNNLIGDWIDRTLIDRKPDVSTVPPNTDSEYPLAGSDTADNANPFVNGQGGNIGPSETFLYRVDGGAFSPFADMTVTDNDAGNTYVEHQALWLNGDNQYNKDKADVVGDLQFIAYTLKFDGPGGKTVGIPVCTRQSNLDYSGCKLTGSQAPPGVNLDDATETHKLQIGFLGDTWIISEMNAPSIPLTGSEPRGLTDENTLTNGGEVKLAKESVSGILNQGESLPVDNLKFQLDDLEAHGDVASAIISILDSNGNVIKKDNVLPGNTNDYQINGKDYKFHVYKVAPGYTFGAKWADVAVFSQELDLKDGQKVDQGVGLNNGYTVALGWKNLDAASEPGPAIQGQDQEQPDALRTIVIFSDTISDVSTSGDTVMKVGDSVPIIQNPSAWQLTYKGLDLQQTDTTSLEFNIRGSDKSISSQDGPMIQTGPVVVPPFPKRVACVVFAPYVEVDSSQSGSTFAINRNDGSGGQLTDSRFFVALNGASTSTLVNLGAPASTQGDTFGALCDLRGAGSIGAATDYTADQFGVAGNMALPAGYHPFGPGTVFMKESSSGSTAYGFALYPVAGLGAAGGVGHAGLEVQYQQVGDGSTGWAPPNGGSILIERGNEATTNNGAANPQDFHLGDLFRSDGFSSAGAGTTGSFGSDPTAVIAGGQAPGPQMWFSVAEKAGTGTSNDFVDYYNFGVLKTATGNPGDATFQFNSNDLSSNSLTSDNSKIQYGHAVANGPGANPITAGQCPSTLVGGVGLYCVGAAPTSLRPSGPVQSGLELVDTGYISERGSKFSTQSSTAVTFNMANKLAHAQWFLAPTSLNASSAATTVVTLGIGDSTTVSGVTVLVQDITEQVGACSAAGGAPSCTADMSGVSAVIMPNNQPSVTVAMPYSGQYGNVVILDSDAVGVNTLVSVGGDKVNSVTAQLLQGAAVDWTATPVVVKEVVQGSKIVVAGAQASDTLTAAQQFVSQLKRT